MLEYRKATKEDICELVRLRIDFIREVQNLTKGDDVSDLKQSLIEYFSDAIITNSFVAWLALENNRIVATSGLCFYTLPPSYKNLSGKTAYIMNMYTEPDYRKRGIAMQLFDKICDEAKTLGYKKLCLHATESGKPLYLKYGFKDQSNEMVFSI
jgi:GNAT superfamily N-acetyltransferase